MLDRVGQFAERCGHQRGSNRGIFTGESIRIRLIFSSLPVYTRSQLALRNGQDKPEIWVAFQGVIYDVTESRLWRNGKHYEHWAGQDLTDELKFAPHTKAVFERFKAIGKLAG